MRNIEKPTTVADVVVGVVITTSVLSLSLVYITACIVSETGKRIFNIIKKENE